MEHLIQINVYLILAFQFSEKHEKVKARAPRKSFIEHPQHIFSEWTVSTLWSFTRPVKIAVKTHIYGL